MTILEHARDYIARGWSIFPLVPGTKRPAVELHPLLTGEKRIEATDFGAWWPGYGIGIICGQPSGGLVVVDVDPRNGGDCEEAQRDCPTGYVVRTGGGGLHLYTRCALGHHPKGKTNRPGVDRQSDGGYVVAPPSLHPDTGRAYEVVSAGDLAPTPEWAFSSPAPALSGAGGPGTPWVADTLSAPGAVEPGTQEETLARLAWWAAGSLERDIAEAVLWGFAQRLTLGNPHDPWTFDHIRQKLDGAYAKREPEFIVQGWGSGSGSSNAVANPTCDSGAGSTPIPASVFAPLVSLEFPDQEWIVRDFVAPGALTEVIGKVKKGKSTLVYQLIRSVLTGEEFLGREVTQSPVVLLTEQEGGSLRATLTRARLYGEPLPLVVIRKTGLSALGEWRVAAARVVDLALWLGARVIVVDTLSRLARITGDAENTSGSVAVLDPLDRAKEAGVACVFVRHARKGLAGTSDDIADAARGSSALTGDMDIVIRLRPHSESDLRVLSWESRLTDDPDDLTLRYNDGSYEVVDAPDGAAVVKHRESIETMRRAIADGAKTYDELAKATGFRSRSTIAKYKKIVEEGEPLPAPPDPTDGRVE